MPAACMTNWQRRAVRRLIVDALGQLQQGGLVAQQRDDALANYAAKLTKEERGWTGAGRLPGWRARSVVTTRFPVRSLH